MNGKIVYVYGYGNPGRQDDGLGPAIADDIENRSIPGVITDSNYQLNIEDAHNIASSEVVIFVDASLTGEGPFTFSKIKPAAEITFTTHAMSPESVIALCSDVYGKDVEAYILAVRGYEWEFGVEFSNGAKENLTMACSFLSEKLTDIMGLK